MTDSVSDPVADLKTKLESAKQELGTRSYALLKSFLISYEKGLGINSELSRISMGLHQAYDIDLSDELLVMDDSLYCYTLFDHIISNRLKPVV